MNNEKEMTIRLVPDGFYVSEQFYSVSAGADYNQRLIEALLNAGIHEFDGDNSLCLVETSRISLSPATASTAEAEAMFQFSYTPANEEETLLEEIDETCNIRYTFAISTEVYNFLRRTLPDITFRHPLPALQNRFRQHSESPYMAVVTDGHSISILTYKEGELALANRIETDSMLNQAYHVMSTWTQMGMDSLNDTLLLESDSEELRKTLSTYIKCVS